jgi:hypothetical protein
MNIQQQRFFDTRGFRIGVLAVLAAAALAGAAFWFGTGLRADTTQSVARSPLGSSLTAVRESRSEDYFGRLINSSAAARSAAPVMARFGDRYDRMSSSSAAATSASLAALAESRTGFNAQLNSLSAAARSVSLAAMDASWAEFYGVNASPAAVRSAALESLRERKSNDLYPQPASLAESQLGDGYGRRTLSAAPGR